MKTLKTLLSVFVLAALLTTSTFAQETSNVTVDAVVIAELSIVTQSDIDLGSIQANTISTLDADTTASSSNTNVGDDFTRGKIRVSGEAGQAINVSWTDAVMNDSTSTTYSAALSTGAATIGNDTEINLHGTSGLAFIYVGGSLPGLSAGTYASDTPIKVIVNYN
jgi:hypothetical protein